LVTVFIPDVNKPFSHVATNGPYSSIMAPVVYAAVVLLFPAIYEPGWRPLVRMLIVWIMIAVLIILIRIPLPAALPRQPSTPALPF